MGYYSTYLRVWEREKQRCKTEMERESVKKHLRKGLGDKLLEDRLQMVCSYITCFELEALPYVVLN